MFEHSRQPLLPRKQFYVRILRSILVSALMLIITVLAGAVGFRVIEGFSWMDSVLNCVLIMTGVGTVGTIGSPAGKLFTGVYSLASTIVFFIILAIIVTPLLHRLLHKFHMDIDT